MYLSKTDYVTYLKHPAWLWLKKHSPDALPKIDENSQAVIDGGIQFEHYAEKIFEGAVKVESKEFGDFEARAAETKRLIEQRVEVILQAVFINGDYLCIADALKLTDEGYELIEIKAVTTPDKEHFCDLAFQKAVIENSGTPITKCFVLHANKDYIRQGDIKLDEITLFTDATTQVEKQLLDTTEKMKAALAVLALETMPSDSLRYVGLGAAKDWRPIFKSLHPEIPPYSIYDLASNKGAGTDKLLATLEDDNVMLMVDIPDSTKLQAHQKDQIAVTKLGQPIIDKDRVKSFLDDLVFPLYFLDYESINLIMPPFDNTWPYEQVVFQHSIHIIQADGTLTHEEYLHDTNTNPMPKLIESLESIIGSTGSIIVWHQTFEKGRHTDIAKLYPAKASFMEDLNSRVVDLEDPFNKRMYQDMQFKGSSSIKKVLPVLCPELTYKTLGIQEGLTASRSWKEAIVDGTRDDKDEILANLKEYCGLDTYAMVAIYKSLWCTMSLANRLVLISLPSLYPTSIHPKFTSQALSQWWKNLVSS